MSYGEHGEFVELEFSLGAAAYPAIRISRDLGCHLELLEAIRSNDRTTTAFFHVIDGRLDSIVEHGQQSEYGDEISVIERYKDECIVQMSLTKSVFRTLAKARIPLQSLTVTDGRAQFVATVPPNRDPEEIISLAKRKHPAVTLVRKHRTSIADPFTTQAAFQSLLTDRLTERQWEALYLAFEYGYFERPRRITQQELSGKMAISPSTFGQHLHTALRKLLTTVFAAGVGQTEPTEGRDGAD